MRPAPALVRIALFSILISMSGFSTATQAQVTDGSNGTATVIGTDALNVRSCPRIECAWVATIELGSQVQITGGSVDGYAPVSSSGYSGWAYDLFLMSSGEDLVIDSGRPGCDRVALIFNAGIGDTPSESILNTLVSTQTPATLFAMGWWAETYPEYLQAMAEANVVIGSHGNTQTFLTFADETQIADEVLTSADTIELVTGSAPYRYYTPYASDSDERVRRTIAEYGYLPIERTISAADYNDDDTAEEVYSRVMDPIFDGAIVELHLDGPATDVSTAVALPWIIADLKARGYTLVTVPEILLPCD